MTQEETEDKNQEPLQEIKPAVKTLTIRDVELQVWQDFVGIKKSRNIHYNQLLQEIFTFYQNFAFDLNSEELALMQEAHRQSPQTLAKRIKKMAVHYAQAIIAAKDKPKPALNLQAKNSAAAAKARADAIIQEIFAHNDNAVNWYDKMFLTKSAILEYAKKKKQQDLSQIAIGHLVLSSCLERHQEQIDAHHRQHGLDSKHNAQAHYERLKTKREKTND